MSNLAVNRTPAGGAGCCERLIGAPVTSNVSRQYRISAQKGDVMAKGYWIVRVDIPDPE